MGTKVGVGDVIWLDFCTPAASGCFLYLYDHVPINSGPTEFVFEIAHPN